MSYQRLMSRGTLWNSLCVWYSLNRMILLDTHVLIWDALDPNRLSEKAKRAMVHANQTDGMIISDITLWEIAMLVQKKRVQISTDCQSFIQLLLQANRIEVRPVTPRIATLSVQLPNSINKDPADRLIVATALAEDVTLVTADQNLRSAAKISTLW